eukprot:gene20039-30839_t
MTSVEKMIVAGSYKEDDVSTLRMLFPNLDRSDAIAVLRRAGDVGQAASQLIDIEEVEDGEDGEEGVQEVRDLPAFFKCPKCFSSDIFLESQTQTVVCLACHHHFDEKQAKKGRVQAVGGGSKEVTARPPKKLSANSSANHPRKPGSQPKAKLKAEDGPVTLLQAIEAGLPEAEAKEVFGIPGPTLQKLIAARALKAETPTLRLVVSHASSPKDKRLIIVPREEGFISLLKQVLVTFSSDLPQEERQAKEDQEQEEGTPPAPEEDLACTDSSEGSAEEDRRPE